MGSGFSRLSGISVSSKIEPDHESAITGTIDSRQGEEGLLLAAQSDRKHGNLYIVHRIHRLCYGVHRHKALFSRSNSRQSAGAEAHLNYQNLLVSNWTIQLVNATKKTEPGQLSSKE